jgi:hypothetical protein
MTERKYSVSEIDKMRTALHQREWLGSMGMWTLDELHGRIEEMLRTYLVAGTDPSELEESAIEAIRAYRERNPQS